MQKKLTNIFLIFMVLSTFLDLHVFYNQISTLIRIMVISILFLIIVFTFHKPKDLKHLFMYFLIVIIYIILHHINALSFKSYVPGNFNYSLFKELLYFFKMLSNVMMFYIISRLNIKYVDVKKYLKLIVLFITGSIIFSDLLSLSYTAYNFDNTLYPMFKWFSLNKYDFMYGSSKGFFGMSNQIVAIILLYLPLMIYEVFNNKKWYDYILTLFSVIALLMIGNRMAIYGPIIEILFMFVTYLFLSIKQKKNYLAFTFCLILIALIVFIKPFSPLQMREYYYDARYNNQNISFMENNPNYTSDSLIESQYLPFEEKQVDRKFYLESYPYNYDQKFWNDILKLPVSTAGNARFVEKAMIKRVKEVNNNPLDNLLGVTYTRVMNIFNIEQDFIMQFYSIGIFGCILFLGLYFLLFIVCAIKILFDLKNKFNGKNIALFLGFSFVFFSSYMTGNILNSISMIVPLTLVLSVLYNEVMKKNDKSDKEKVLGFDCCTSLMPEIIDKIKKSHEQLFIVNINPLIVLESKKDETKKRIFNSQKIQIPDGEGVVLASKLRGGNIKQRIAGIDLMLALCSYAQENKKTVFLYGAKDGVANQAQKRLEEKYPGIKIVGTCSGYVRSDIALKDIKKSKPDILFVALGSPKQEDFIIENMKELKNTHIFMPVGGSFDVISGNLKRAPKLLQKLKLEWLYRMIKEPKRFKEIFKLIKFMILSIFE